MEGSTTPSPKKSGKFVTTIVVLALVGLVVVLDLRRRDAESKLAQLSSQVAGQQGNQEQNKEAARLILEKVRRLYDIPETPPATVATIVDVEQLRKKNAFYAKAKNGDHLIITADRAILYDPDADKIVDVVPVQVQPPAQAQAGQVAAKTASSATATSSSVISVEAVK